MDDKQINLLKLVVVLIFVFAMSCLVCVWDYNNDYNMFRVKALKTDENHQVIIR